ncbi:hypothetical protein PVAP13_3NG218281 [Panicum virgatum]|uniref:Uncharacterized protein n=1 Tax=Panicum virgatum TaxID=38727 RepID=A0A8T0U2I3_PANVG|nr:hypothetical protein PVAP13_3NG218281 [Panicum virgatum]
MRWSDHMPPRRCSTIAKVQRSNLDTSPDQAQPKYPTTMAASFHARPPAGSYLRRRDSPSSFRVSCLQAPVSVRHRWSAPRATREYEWGSFCTEDGGGWLAG